MVKKDDKYCPFCNRPWKFNAGIRGRLKKEGHTEVKCLGCKEWFTVFDRPKRKEDDKRTKAYKELLLRKSDLLER